MGRRQKWAFLIKEAQLLRVTLVCIRLMAPLIWCIPTAQACIRLLEVAIGRARLTLRLGVSATLIGV